MRFPSVVLTLALVAAFVPPGRAAPPSRLPNSEYLLQGWGIEDGLPEASATSIVQTRDGYLWFGTFNGLVRYNGDQFTVLNPNNTPELPSAGIVKLYLDMRDRFWVSTYQGLVLREGQNGDRCASQAETISASSARLRNVVGAATSIRRAMGNKRVGSHAATARCVRRRGGMCPGARRGVVAVIGEGTPETSGRSRSYQISVAHSTGAISKQQQVRGEALPSQAITPRQARGSGVVVEQSKLLDRPLKELQRQSTAMRTLELKRITGFLHRVD